MTLDPSWPVLGRTDNATFLLADPGVLVVVPDEGCVDDESTARQSIAFQQAHWRTQARCGAAVVLMDRVGHQTRTARRVYQTEVDASLLGRFALVSCSLFGHAVASVFMGLSRPAIPTRMFGNLARALEWARANHLADSSARGDGDAT